MKTSKYTKELLEDNVKKVTTFSDLVRLLTNSEKVHGSMISYLKNKLIYFGIDYSHFNGINPNKKNGWNKLTKDDFIENYLTENPKRKTCNSNLKKWIIKFELLDYGCCVCENNGNWMGKPMTLQLDHKNGLNYDNRLSNLRFICPNCHSQTDNFTGKNSKKNITPSYIG